jgi:DNA invertase Pin-like site-specific DNA recombinase
MVSAWALLAVSSDSQADTLQHQRAWANEEATKQGWTIDRFFEGVSSGVAGPRRLLRDLIAELRSLPADARPSWLLMVRADRVGRGRLVESQVVLHEIGDLGVRIWTRDGGELKLDSATDQIIAAVKAGLATLENEVRRDKATAVYRRKRIAGEPIGNKRPYGLALGPSGDAAIEDQAEAVRAAFAMRAEGQGYHAIALRMAEIAPPVRYKKSGEHAMKWTTHRLRRMLANRSYVGPIIDELMFRRVQSVSADLARAATPGTHRHPWPLTGTIRCYCGSMLIGQATGKESKFRYYTCRATWNHNGHFRLNPAASIEAQFIELLRDLAVDPLLVAHYRRTNLAPASPALLRRSLRSMRAELATLDQRRDRVWEMHEKGLVRDNDVQVRLDTLSERRVEVVDQIGRIETQVAIAEEASRQSADVDAIFAEAVATYENAAVDDQRRIARTVALMLGGLTIEENRSLVVRRPTAAPGKGASAKRL